MALTAELDNELIAPEITPKACLPQPEQPTDEPDSDAPATDAHAEGGVAVTLPESSAKPEIAELSSSEDSFLADIPATDGEEQRADVDCGTNAIVNAKAVEALARDKAGVIDEQVTFASSTSDSEELAVIPSGGQPASYGLSTASSPNSYSGADTVTANDEQPALQLSKQVLGELLDESIGELRALENFDVDVESYRPYWFGSHSKESREALLVEHLQKGECTANVDGARKLLDDPDVFLLARENGVPITIRILQGLTEDQKIEFILRAQVGKRVTSEEEQRKMKNEWIEVQIRLGTDYKTIAKMAKVCPNTVRNVETRAAANTNSKHRIAKKDRRKGNWTDKDIEEARRLRAAGKKNSEIAVRYGASPATVGKWFKVPNAPSATEAKRSASKKVKMPRSTAAAPSEPQPIKDIAASDVVPKLHRLAQEHLRLTTEALAELCEPWQAQAREEIEEVSTNVEDLLTLSFYGRRLAAGADAQLEQLLGTSVDVDEAPPGDSDPDRGLYEVGQEFDAEVLEVQPDGVYVHLPNGKCGVIDKRDTGLTLNAPPEENETVRVRVKGFDLERDCQDLRLLGRRSRDERANRFSPDIDHQSHTCAKVTESQRLSTAKEVI